MNEMEIERQNRMPRKISTNAVTAPTVDIVAGPVRPISRAADAIREFDAESDRGAIGALLKHAAVLSEANEHRLAMNLLRNVLIRAPGHPEAVRRMGVSLREEGRYEEALKCFRALLKSELPENVRLDAQILVAETLYLAERDDLALAAYREILKNVIGDQDKLFEIYKNIGNIHVRAGDFESAEEYYDKAYTIRSSSDVLMVNYGTLEIQRESIAEAVLRFRRAVEINPENDKGWVGLALVHRQMGDLELAWANVQRALDINRRNRTAIRLVVDWGLTDRDFSVAIARLQDYLEAEGEDAEMSFTLAKIFTHVGRLREARLELERVIALDPAIEGAETMKRLLDQELAKSATETV